MLLGGSKRPSETVHYRARIHKYVLIVALKRNVTIIAIIASQMLLSPYASVVIAGVALALHIMECAIQWS